MSSTPPPPPDPTRPDESGHLSDAVGATKPPVTALFNHLLPLPDGRPGTLNGYLARAKDPAAPGVVVIQEMLGVNADMRQVCDHLAEQGFHALCPDLYWRLRPGVVFSEHDASERQDALALSRAFDVDQGVNDLQHVMDWLRQMDGQPRKVGCIGYCLGGLLSYRVAACCRSDAAVVYYGAGIERYLDEAGTVACPLMIHLAAHDEFIPPSTQAILTRSLAPLPTVALHLYREARHGFARRGGRHFDPVAAELADARSLQFLRKYLH
ncbi:carboxymethylenebutenolidase [Roseateles sp. YR242]|uniref:dienelactone hydrolase family protein n=1 Tax=Roseateles sp. YR242 TaxID=1855305 RepID=UPI0008C31666|nr:dienelactone hydrolase family protein [Roseateles sp. YR242]SEK25798.1 carboxymethylenebutenolidase [Roseateles sp. YR242]